LEANEKWAILHAIGIQNGQYSTPSAYKMQFIFDGRKINCILYADIVEYYPLFIIGLVSSNMDKLVWKAWGPQKVKSLAWLAI
jgi:hypothetical protein